MQVPFTGLLMKEVPPEGDTINGMFVPGGTRIAHNTLGMQRSAAIFGDDVSIFRPERWLEASPEKSREMTTVVEMVFGHGRWMCAGKAVAFIELNKIFVEVRYYSVYSSLVSSHSEPPMMSRANAFCSYFATSISSWSTLHTHGTN